MLHRVTFPQETETALREQSNAGFSWRGAYARSADLRAANLSGQDYLAYAADDQMFAFALCDGVSQSFYGDLAARQLGDALLAWLLDASPKPEAQLREEFLSLLARLTQRATEIVQRHPIPADIPPMMRDVLEEKRRLGSETTLVAGRLDLPNPDLRNGRLLLAWAGDSRVRIWGLRDKELGGHADASASSSRWSTLRGLLGDVTFFTSELKGSAARGGVAGVAAYSDGLGLLDALPLPPSSGTLGRLIAEQEAAPASDDISFLEVWIGSSPAHWWTRALARVGQIQVRAETDRARLSWAAAPGATAYQVNIFGSTVPVSLVPTPAWSTPILLPGAYEARVRAVAGNEMSEWSDPARFAIAAPDPVVAAQAKRPTPSPAMAPVSPAGTLPSSRPAFPGRRPRSRARGVLVASAALLATASVILGVIFGLHIPGGQPSAPRLTPVPKIADEVSASSASQPLPLGLLPPAPCEPFPSQASVTYARWVGPQDATAATVFAGSGEAASRLACLVDHGGYIMRVAQICSAADVVYEYDWDTGAWDSGRLPPQADGARLIKAVCYSTDGESLILGCTDGTIWISKGSSDIWDKQPLDLGMTITAIACSQQHGSFAAGTADGAIWLYSRPGAPGVCLSAPYQGAVAVASLCFSPNGESLASLNLAGDIRLWNVWTRVEVLTETSCPDARQIVFASDGSPLSVCGSGKFLPVVSPSRRVGGAVLSTGLQSTRPEASTTSSLPIWKVACTGAHFVLWIAIWAAWLHQVLAVWPRPAQAS